MSFLESEKGLPNFSKAVISVWFHVPQASIDAAGAETQDGIFKNIIPLIVLGPTGKSTPWRAQSHTIPTLVTNSSGESNPAGPITTTWTELGEVQIVIDGVPLYYYWVCSKNEYAGPKPTSSSSSSGAVTVTSFSADAEEVKEPSFIGVDCTEGKPTLLMNFETGTLPIISGYNARTGYTAQVISDVSTGGYTTGTVTHKEKFDAWGDPTGIEVTEGSATTVPEVFTETISGGTDVISDVSVYMHKQTGAIRSDSRGIKIVPDVWHHLLVSVDLESMGSHGVDIGESPQTPIAQYITGVSRLYVALDDVNYTKGYLSSNWIMGAGPNDVTTEDAYSVAGGSGFDGGGRPSYALADPTIPAAKYAVGIPATSGYHDNIRQVQMAELQIFTGVTLDTGVEANRRAFINSRGEPVDPLYGLEKARGIFGPETPNVTPSPPVQLLGKMPDISLTRMASNWGAGVNLGTAKVSLKPTGAIKPVRPDPVVGK